MSSSRRPVPAGPRSAATPRRPGEASPAPARAAAGPDPSGEDDGAPPARQAALGRTVRRLREGAGFSQEAFADRCGIHRTGMSALERGLTDPRLSTLDRIAAGLGMSTGTLVAEVDRQAERDG